MTGQYALKVEGVNEQIQVGLRQRQRKKTAFIYRNNQDLHNIGYLHRDVKPGNYTIGRAELNELRKVYILDFGMCRKFTNEQGVIRKPRQAAGFRGTVRYAPISCHLQRELCRYTRFYMIFNLQQKRVRQPQFINELFPPPCPREFQEVLTYTDSLKYYDAPNYQHIYGIMRRALQSSNAQEFPYDWEMGGPTAYVLA
uniref:non-specific serine/threonine protein kinase n=1 Tax=Heterorhabditis bacteriophora TaxID=37862 RepID=A0A1I7XQF1_HETBA